MNIVEYSALSDGVPVLPPNAVQSISESGTSQASAAFQASTNFVEISNDSTSVFGVTFGTSPTAVFADSIHIQPNSTRLFQVPAGGNYKVAVII